jgi:glycosyltransferase involved in cell wall biosynthesis
MGHQITVVSTKKTHRDGLLTEDLPEYVNLLELNGVGRISPSQIIKFVKKDSGKTVHNRSLLGDLLLRFKRFVSKTSGQLLDHRIVFALQFAFPWLDKSVENELRSADIVMSTSPPWPLHLAGLIIKKRFSKPWVADYRDQFSGSHIQSGSPWFQKREIEMERLLLKSADAVVAISGPMKEYYQQFHPSVFCIENGYEETLFKKSFPANGSFDSRDSFMPKRLVIRYLGTITADRIPLAFFKALARVNQQLGAPIFAEFYGESSLLLKTISEKIPEVGPFIILCQQLPYSAAIDIMQNADALFFIETSNLSSHSSRGVLTTKLFEYLATRKPIIAEISEQALAASYIKRAKADLVISEDIEEIESALLRLREGKLNLERDEVFIQGLSRRLKAAELERLFQKIVNQSTDLRLT